MPRILQVTLLLVASSVLSLALPTSLLTDAKGARNSAKRVQEVVMFGNQQNKPADAYYSVPAIKKRAAPQDDDVFSTMTSKTDTPDAGDADNEPMTPRRVVSHTMSTADLIDEMRKEANQNRKTVAQYEKGYQYGVGKEALEKQAENSLLKSDVYGDPATNVNEYRYYGGGDPRDEKLSTNKRSVRYPAVDASARLKRDLELDPESLLALISLWQAQRVNNHPSYKDRADWSNQHYGYVQSEPEENNNEEDEDDITSDGNSEWLDGPVTPTRYQYQDLANQYNQYPGEEYRYNTYPNMKRSSPAGYYPAYPRYEQKYGGQWGGFIPDKRFMVAKKRQASFDRWDEPMLARLLATQPRNPGMVAHRRLVL